MQAFLSFLCLILLLQASSCQLTQQYGDAQNTRIAIPAGLPTPKGFGLPEELGTSFFNYNKVDFVMDNENNVYFSFTGWTIYGSYGKEGVTKFSRTNQTLWSRELHSDSSDSLKMAMHDHTLVVLGLSAYAIDSETGQILWSLNLNCGTANRVAVAQDHDQQYYIYALCDDSLWKLNLADGSKMWTEPIQDIGDFAVSPTIVFGSNGHSLAAYSTKDGTSLWSQSSYKTACVITNPISRCLMLNLKLKLLYAFSDITFLAFKFDGSLAWSQEIHANIYNFGLSPPEHDLLYIITNSQELLALNALNGSLIPHMGVRMSYLNYRFYISQDNNIYLPTDDGYLYVVEGETFKTLAKVPISSTDIEKFAFTTQGQFIVGDDFEGPYMHSVLTKVFSPSQCPFNCYNNGQCQTDGECLCNKGYQGYCNQCATNYYGSSCSTYCEKNETCSGRGSCNSDGQCDCIDHFGGENCNQCATHWYGASCDTYCSSIITCNDNGKCGSHGECICNNYFSQQTNCTSCMPNYYGDECNTYCVANVTCNNRGSCTNAGQCLCETNYYGADCSAFCNASTTCQGRGTCNSDGACINCSGNYTGPTCSDCTANHYGPNCSLFCDPQTTCHGNGRCSEQAECICEPNYVGTHCESCIENHYGPNCATFCNANTTCNQRGVCSSDGTCLCKANYYGPDCSSFCDDSTTCSGHGQCSQEGKCLCSPHFASSNCSTCATDYYGAECSTFCNTNTKCHGNGGCNLQGQCQCYANFTVNTNCSGCIEDHYGPQCSTVCNKATCKNGTCKPDTGACSCLPGYTGSDCSEHEEKMAMSAGKIAGIVVGSVAALVLAVLVFWFVTKKNKAGYASLH